MVETYTTLKEYILASTLPVGYTGGIQCPTVIFGTNRSIIAQMPYRRFTEYSIPGRDIADTITVAKLAGTAFKELSFYTVAISNQNSTILVIMKDSQARKLFNMLCKKHDRAHRQK